MIVVLGLVFILYRYIRRKSLEKNGPSIDIGNNENKNDDIKQIVF